MKYLYTLAMLLNCAFAYEANARQALSFAENKGQWHANALYRAEIPGGAMFISNTGPVYYFASQEDLDNIHEQAHEHPELDFGQSKVKVHAYALQFIGANPSPVTISKDKISYYENFFVGNDASRWASQVQHYTRIEQQNVFDKIDLVYYAKEKSLKYDFIVKPGADPGKIRLKMDGAGLAVNERQQLVITTSVNTVIEDAPVAFQVIKGETLFVDCRYQVNQGIIGFETGSYNAAYPLIIDPDLIFATYSGAQSSSFYSYTSTFDYDGNTIIAALGFGMGWPTQTGAYDITFNMATDVALMKINGTGSNRLFATYLGGNLADLPLSLSSGNTNHIYLVGNTQSTDFPTTANCIQATFGGGNNDIFIAKISRDGTQLLASTYLGGNASDGFNIYAPIGGSNSSPSVLKFNKHDHSLWFTSSSASSNFPTTGNALQTTQSQNGPLLIQVDTNLTQLRYSTFFNINSSMFFNDLKINNANQLYLCGSSAASNIGTSNALNPGMLGGTSDGFVMKFNANNKTIIACTYLGTGNTDVAIKLAITPNQERIFVTGTSLGTYPVTANTYTQPNSYNYIQALDSNLALNLGACNFGGTGYLYTSDMFVSNCSALGIAGIKGGNTFPLTPDAYANTGEFWFGNFDLNLSGLIYGTCYGYGGHTHNGTFNFDTAGNIHHSVCDMGGSFVTTTNAWSPTKQTGGYDMISFKFDMATVDKLLSFALSPSSKDTSCAPNLVTFVNNSYNYNTYHWDFGNGSTSTLFEPSVNYTLPGVYKVVLTGHNIACNFEDKDSMYILVKPNQVIKPYVHDTLICSHEGPVTMGLDSISPAYLSNYYTIDWQPHTAIAGQFNASSATINHKIAQEVFVHINGINNDSLCITDTFVKVKVNYQDSSAVHLQPQYAEVCRGDSVLISASGGVHYAWTPTTYLQFFNDYTAYSTPGAPITYLVRITDSLGCIYERSSRLNFLERDRVEAGPDQVVKFGEPAQLHGITNSQNFYWLVDNVPSFHNQATPVVYPADTSLYYLVGVNSSGCTETDSVFVYVNELKVPNVFSPNGDGLNDDFFPIPYNDYMEIVNFSIYNRYGQRVFYTSKLRKAWDGRHKERPADLGVYMYHVEYKIGSKTYHLKGDVTLIR